MRATPGDRLECENGVAIATRSPSDFYELRVRGVLDSSWSAWFDGLEVASDPVGGTRIAGPVVDQAALHGLLAKVRDLGLPLLSVRLIAPDEEPTGERPA